MRIITIYLLLFTACLYAQKITKARQAEYKKALDTYMVTYPDSSTAAYFYNRGGIKQDYLDFAGAYNDYTKSLEIKPGSAGAYYNRGIVLLDTKKYNEAVRDFDRVIALQPKMADAYNNRGICKYKMDDYTGAVQDYDMAITLQPDHAEAYNNRGVSKIKYGSKNEGCTDLHKAYALGDKNAVIAIKNFCDKK